MIPKSIFCQYSDHLLTARERGSGTGLGKGVPDNVRTMPGHKKTPHLKQRRSFLHRKRGRKGDYQIPEDCHIFTLVQSSPKMSNRSTIALSNLVG